MANALSLLGSLVDTVDLNLTNFDQANGQNSDSMLAGIGNALGLRNGYDPKKNMRTVNPNGASALFGSNSSSMVSNGNSVIVTLANGKQRQYDVVRHSTVEKWGRRKKSRRRRGRGSGGFVTKNELQLILGALGK